MSEREQRCALEVQVGLPGADHVVVEEVRQVGVTVQKVSNAFVLGAGVYAENNQVMLITPFILGGAMAPVTAADLPQLSGVYRGKFDADPRRASGDGH